MTEDLNNTHDAEGADFQIPRTANGVRLYANANLDHGILQMVDMEEGTEETKAPTGDHVLAQVAFRPEALRSLSGQLNLLADELDRVQADKGRRDGTN